MAITNRNFKGGEKFVAAYKGKTHTAVAVKKDGAIQFVLDGGKTAFKTLSGAGAAVLGLNKEGKPRTCNGFAFWTVATETASPKPTTSKATAKAKKATAKKATAKKAPAPKVVAESDPA
jgi:hypothetical protein